MKVSFPSNGRTTKGWLAVPRSGSGPGVLVFQEWWGLVPHIRKLCDRLAEVGFTALAPDLYDGRTTTDPDEAGRLMMGLEVPRVAADAGGAAEFLLGHEACASAKLGAMGFCLGGQLALFTACSFPARIGACVDFYGIHPNVKPDLTRLEAPVLGIFAERDAYVDAAAVADLAKRLRAAKKPFEFKTYEGVDHAFMNDTRKDVFDAAAAQDAWNRTVDFLRAHVK
jgi:carboxymethylenebutenolidase